MCVCVCMGLVMCEFVCVGFVLWVFFDYCVCVLVTCVVISMSFVLLVLGFCISIYPYLLLV